MKRCDSVHTDLDGARAAQKRILALMEQVRLPEVERIFASYRIGCRAAAPAIMIARRGAGTEIA